MMSRYAAILCFLFAALSGRLLRAAGPTMAYRLGADDKLLFRCPDIEELNEKPVLVSKEGTIDLPLVGELEVRGLTLEQVRTRVLSSLRKYYHEPQVSIEISDFASQQISVLGEVTNAGVYQLRGGKTLAEVLAMAGGVKADAGYTVRVTRLEADGSTKPLSYNLRDILMGGSLSGQTPVKPGDVITVSKASIVYVLGDVRKPGGFALGDQEHTSVLTTLAMAEGPASTAALGQCSLLRKVSGQPDRKKITVNVKKLMSGSIPDVLMEQDDVLIVPSSSAKKVTARTAEVALQTVSGIVIWRRP